MPESNCDVQELITAGKCFSISCLSEDNQRVARLQLLCDILATQGGGGGGVTSILAGAGISVDAATGDVTITNTAPGPVTLCEGNLASPATWDISNWTNFDYTDLTTLLAPYGYDAAAQAAVAAAITAGKRVRMFGYGTIDIATSFVDGPGRVWVWGFNPFFGSAGAASFESLLNGSMTTGQTVDNCLFNFDFTTAADFLTTGKAPARAFNASTSSVTSSSATAPAYNTNSIRGAANPASGTIWAYWEDRSGGDITQFDVKLFGFGIQVIG